MAKELGHHCDICTSCEHERPNAGLKLMIFVPPLTVTGGLCPRRLGFVRLATSVEVPFIW
jgi:hypothetical protein